MDVKTLFAEILKISPMEQSTLYELFYPIVNKSSNKVGDYLNDIREARFSNRPHCPYCGSVSIIGHGKYKTRQRYMCKDCGKTFNDTSASPMAGTHYPNKWARHIQLMIKGVTLKEVAEELDIHISTAFYWRHKVLNALQSLSGDELSGVIESDEKFFLESQKGKNQVVKFGKRKARKRGGKSNFRGLSKEQVCIVVAMDRDGHLVSKMAGRGKISAKQIESAIGDSISDNSILCTDSARNYEFFAKQKNLKHFKVNGSKKQYVVEKIYHIQHVNSYHEKLETWINRHFNGVATKNLDKYLCWHRFLEINRRVDKTALKKFMLTSIFKADDKTTVRQLRPA